ncbi:hypothetical protein [Streptomyces sp. R44]|uniref:Uncharacterized protein n=1 Tax=Streptomyces sp. R44 TaxID=3238633 RepID=A0AB39T5J1_9ACTN
MNGIKLGDRVEITRYRGYSTDGDTLYVGLRGTVDRIDDGDSLPFRVDTDDEGQLWAAEVRKVPNDREHYVTRAKELLEGTHAMAGDILRMARFLAGEDGDR